MLSYLMLGQILGPDVLVVLVVVVVLFGGSQLPKLARSLGSAKNQFEAGLNESNLSSSEINSEKIDLTKKVKNN